MQKVLDFLKGKKKFIAAAIVGVLAAANALGYTVPAWVNIALSSFGLGS